MTTPSRVVAFNHCAIPPWIIASDHFNLEPRPLEISGVRRSNRDLFEKLDQQADPEARGHIFHDYLDVKFALHQWSEYSGKARSSIRNSYLRFLNGWQVDSNNVEGAVLKSWVESRFGVIPTFHRGILRRIEEEEDNRFARDRMKGSARTNAIYSQLDLVYEYCQYEYNRRFPTKKTLTLYRGTNDPEEHPLIERRSQRENCIRLNNLVSFTSDREKAWEFGSSVWQATCAISKIVFSSDLLPSSLLSGENEYLLIGGDYWVKELLY
ncbi:NAD(+)--dinitrogen-reductase ADP-D-ribosyltransferase [Verrucomicrobiia bacterium DG1235]|nr:NAD(+)--dinitrogen-reductase ADP-D-ribosyltransferase [Verrucomicrobiae bacterium DG1235]